MDGSTAVIFALLILTSVTAEVETPVLCYSYNSVSVLLEGSTTIQVKLCDESNNSSSLLALFTSTDEERLTVQPQNFIFSPSSIAVELFLTGLLPGHAALNVSYLQQYDNITVTVLRSFELETFSIVIGWLYFAAWSLSFYPQVHKNYSRKSVVGLNFDLVALNVLGFFMYSLYNGGVFWSSYIQELYYEQHPAGVLPVMPNDLFFSIHGFFVCLLVSVQCYIYESADQSVSYFGKAFYGLSFSFVFISLFWTVIGVSQWLTWLRFLEFCSYVKLSITTIKYLPQAYMNFSRKSTAGWSIGTVLLDFTGGVLSMGQMIVNAWNYDDWSSIFGDPTKFGLGLVSALFDVLFMVQHYFLYHPESASGYKSLA